MNFDDFKYNEKNIPKGYDKRSLYFEELKLKFLDEIKNSTENKEYFSKYETLSVENFMLGYAERKAYLAERYDSYVNRKREVDLELKKEAEDNFSLIKQKKLFNMQLEWRAENMDIEGIKVGRDFIFWGRNINECYFLPKITKEEVQTLKNYIYSSYYRPYKSGIKMLAQDYFMIITLEMLDETDFLNFYSFYDKKMKTGGLLLLQDIRGNKEDVYRSASREEEAIKFEKVKEEYKKNPPPTPPPKAPKLNNHKFNYVNIFANEFETDPHILELFRLKKKQNVFERDRNDIDEYEEDDIYNDENICDDYIDRMIWEIRDFNDKVPLTKCKQWRGAIKFCAEEYKRKKVLEFLDEVYQEYLLLEETGIYKGRSKEQLLEAFEKDDYMHMNDREQILRGRKLLGEPENFDF